MRLGASLRFDPGHIALGMLLAAMWLLIGWPAVAWGADALAECDALRLRGRYEEAQERYESLLESNPLEAGLGIARCAMAIGHYEQAEARLEKLAEREPKSADVLAELAGLLLDRGEVDRAEQRAREALAVRDSHSAARWVVAEAARQQGRAGEARDGYAWFAEHPPRDADTRAEDWLWFGRGLAQHARWQRDSNAFARLVNDVLPRAWKSNADYWPARLDSARLFLEKYNQPDAMKDLNAALAINPRAAEAHVLRAQLALQGFELDKARRSLEVAFETNPNLLSAQQTLADVLLAELKPAEALERLEQALQRNPHDEPTLGRIAAIYLTLDGQTASDQDDSRLTRLAQKVTERNPHCGRFYQAAGESCELMRRFRQAAEFYATAFERSPELIDIRGQLGLTLMRMGDESRAAELLDESFEADPFNVRVKNMLEVLDVLQGYAVLETEHFVLKFDRGMDQLLAEEMADFLEDEVYPAAVRQMGFAPPEKTLIEIFNRAKNTDGHGWFSARMVGLPFIGTVGACAGKIVAITSPAAMPERFNWARVMRHEFIHVINLQQTDFNIPHWFTEGLAVSHEDLPRPTEWNAILARRARAEQLFTLDNINLGFIRPGNTDDWTLAYCQAELYVEFMREQFGEDGPARLLRANAEHFETPRAIEQAFDVSLPEFERGYRAFVDRLVSQISDSDAAPNRDAKTLEAAIAENPQDAEALAKLAYQQLEQGRAPQARALALRAQAVDPRHPLAAYVLARIYLSIGDAKTALPLLTDSLDEAQPNPRGLGLLAALRVKAKQWDEAARLYEIGAKKFPADDRWLKGLARVYLETADTDRLPTILARLAELDYDSVTLRRKLTELAAAESDWPEAARWANQVLQIDVQDADCHALLARALVEQSKHEDAIKRYQRALRLVPENHEWRVSLARSFVETERPELARQQLEQVLQQVPDHPQAQSLLESLAP
ncbi:MAG: tetratricopeptide repeat protein [Pirellulaceae bacterium]